MQDPVAVANYFVEKSLADGGELTPMKLVKLVYISHGWHLALTGGKPLLLEAVEAWKYGPVIPTVYHHFKSYADSQITRCASLQNPGNSTVPKITEKELETFLNRIWEVYRGFTGLQLSTITHQKDTPWDIIWNQKNGSKEKHVIIPNDLIAQHYQGLMTKTH